MTTSLYAAVLGIMLIVLSVNTIKTRRKIGVGIGDGNKIEIIRCMRAQANFAEYAPFFLILLGYVEMNGLPIWAIHFFGLLFLAGRVMHAYGLLAHEKYDDLYKLVISPKWRVRGMICTFVAIGSLSTIMLIQYLK